MTLCNKCGEEYDLCCDGRIRCPNCDGPCLGCYSGPGPGEEEDAVCPDCGAEMVTEYDDPTCPMCGIDMHLDSEYDYEAGDICTYDHCTFYQYGKVILTLKPEDNHVAALRVFMAKEGHWMNAYWISDHGNAHLIDLG